jgi:hypothetical protein
VFVHRTPGPLRPDRELVTFHYLGCGKGNARPPAPRGYRSLTHLALPRALCLNCRTNRLKRRAPSGWDILVARQPFRRPCIHTLPDLPSLEWASRHPRSHS